MNKIRLKIEAEVVLDPLWYDEVWHADLLADGMSDEQALKEMICVSIEEDWTSLYEEIFGNSRNPEKFISYITEIEAVA